MVAKKLIKEIIPRSGLPISLGSNNAQAFMARLSQALSKALNINWKLRCVCHPQSSGKVERMGRTLEIGTRYTLETGANGVDLLPCALLKV